MTSQRVYSAMSGSEFGRALDSVISMHLRREASAKHRGRVRRWLNLRVSICPKERWPELDPRRVVFG